MRKTYDFFAVLPTGEMHCTCVMSLLDEELADAVAKYRIQVTKVYPDYTTTYMQVPKGRKSLCGA